MKTLIDNILRTVALFTVVAALGSCGKYQEIADAAYPDQVVYMPAAASIYHLSGPGNVHDVPTPGHPYRFRIDRSAGKVTIPLGVVRGGISKKGSVSIDLRSRPDTVNRLIDQHQLQAELLPAAAYAIPATVTLADGNDIASFDLTVDLQFVLDRPGQVFALAVGISSKERATNPKLETTIVVFSTDLFREEATQ